MLWIWTLDWCEARIMGYLMATKRVWSSLIAKVRPPLQRSDPEKFQQAIRHQEREPSYCMQYNSAHSYTVLIHSSIEVYVIIS